MELLRTPDDRFADLPGYPFAPHYVEIPDGDGGDAARPPPRRGPRRRPGRAAPARRAVLELPLPAHDPGAGRRRAPLPSPPTSSASAAPTSRPSASDYTYARQVEWLRSALFDAPRPARHHARRPGLGRAASACGSSPSTPTASPGSCWPTPACPPATSASSDAFLAWQKFSQEVPEIPDRRHRQRRLHHRPRPRGDRRLRRPVPRRDLQGGGPPVPDAWCRPSPTTRRRPPTGPRGRSWTVATSRSCAPSATRTRSPPAATAPS